MKGGRQHWQAAVGGHYRWLRSYRAGMNKLGNGEKQEAGR
jgi:hypothetical protein